MTGEGKQSDPFEALSISPRRGLSAGMNGRSRPPDPVAMQGPGGTKVESASRFGGKKRANKKEAFRGEAKKWHTEEKTDIPVNQICRTITPSIPCRLRTPSPCRSFQKVPLHYMALLLSFAFFLITIIERAGCLIWAAAFSAIRGRDQETNVAHEAKSLTNLLTFTKHRVSRRRLCV